jgi:hypothetical protein
VAYWSALLAWVWFSSLYCRVPSAWSLAFVMVRCVWGPAWLVGCTVLRSCRVASPWPCPCPARPPPWTPVTRWLSWPPSFGMSYACRSRFWGGRRRILLVPLRLWLPRGSRRRPAAGCPYVLSPSMVHLPVLRPGVCSTCALLPRSVSLPLPCDVWGWLGLCLPRFWCGLLLLARGCFGFDLMASCDGLVLT